MGTSWAEVITTYAMTQINDIRLNQKAAEDPALFYRVMSEYLVNAIPLFNSPPEEQEWLSATPSTYGDTTWTAPAPKSPADEGGTGENPEAEESLTAWQLDTGLVGFGLMSVVQEGTSRTGELLLLPYTQATYDAETGVVTFPDDTPEGTRFRLDFYQDGTFDRDLSDAEKRILGLCMKEIWTEHFSADWLNMQPKVNDKSFNVGSEANHIRSMTERGRTVSSALYAEMKKYEQNLAYNAVVRNRRPPPGGGR